MLRWGTIISPMLRLGMMILNFALELKLALYSTMKKLSGLCKIDCQWTILEIDSMCLIIFRYLFYLDTASIHLNAWLCFSYYVVLEKYFPCIISSSAGLSLQLFVVDNSMTKVCCTASGSEMSAEFHCKCLMLDM